MLSLLYIGLIVISNAAVPTVKLQNAASNDSYIPWIGLGCAIPGSDQFDKGFSSSTQWLQTGGRYFDEAYCYPSRQGVASGVLNYTQHYTKIARSDLFIVSKVGGCSGDKMGYNEVLDQVNNELSLWQTTYLDMVLIHWCSDNSGHGTSSDPICNVQDTSQYNATICRQRTWKGLIELFLNKSIKAIGVSNFEVKHLNDLMNYKYPIDGKIYIPTVNQMQFHGYWHEYDLLSFCQKHNILYNSWSTLGTPDIESNKWKGNTPILTQHPIAMQIGNKYNKTAAQIWLRWQHQLNILVIPRSNNITHMKENMDIFDFQLNDDDMKQLYNVTAPPYPTNLVYLNNASNPQNLP